MFLASGFLWRLSHHPLDTTMIVTQITKHLLKWLFITVPTPLQPLQNPDLDFCGSEALVALKNFVIQQVSQRSQFSQLSQLQNLELTQALINSALASKKDALQSEGMIWNSPGTLSNCCSTCTSLTQLNIGNLLLQLFDSDHSWTHKLSSGNRTDCSPLWQQETP